MCFIYGNHNSRNPCTVYNVYFSGRETITPDTLYCKCGIGYVPLGHPVYVSGMGTITLGHPVFVSGMGTITPDTLNMFLL